MSSELKAELPHGSQYWRQFGVRKAALDGLGERQLDSVVLHCDLTKWGEPNRVGLRRRLFEYLSTSGSITIVHITCPMDRLILHVTQRVFGSSNTLISRLMLLLLRARSLAGSITLGLAKRLLLKNNSPEGCSAAKKFQTQLSKLELYQNLTQAGLDSIYLEWATMINTVGLTGTSIKQIYLEPKLEEGNYTWRRLPTPGHCSALDGCNPTTSLRHPQ